MVYTCALKMPWELKCSPDQLLERSWENVVVDEEINNPKEVEMA